MADIPAIVNYETKFCAENMQPVFNVCYGALDGASTPAAGRTALDVYSKSEAATLSYVDGTFLKTSGGTMSGSLSVVAGATGDQAMQASEIAALVAGVTNTALKSANGWFKDEKTGLIIQWGITPSVAAGTSAGFNLPIPFPAAALMSVGSVYGAPVTYGGTSVSLTQIGIYNRGSNAAPFSWIAIGY